MSASQDGALERLMDIMGDRANRNLAQRLLNDAGGSVDDAAAMFLSQAPSPVVGGSRGKASKVQELRELLQDTVSNRQLERLLASAKGNVGAAVDLHFAGELAVGR